MRVRARRRGEGGGREGGRGREVKSGIPRPLIASTSGSETKHINQVTIMITQKGSEIKVMASMSDNCVALLSN